MGTKMSLFDRACVIRTIVARRTTVSQIHAYLIKKGYEVSRASIVNWLYADKEPPYTAGVLMQQHVTEVMSKPKPSLRVGKDVKGRDSRARGRGLKRT